MLVELPLDPAQCRGGLLLHEGLLAATILIGTASIKKLIEGLIAVDMGHHILQFHFNVIAIVIPPVTHLY